MGTITGTALINQAATVLFDTNNIKWSRDELIKYVNDGQRALVSILPETSSTVSVETLVAGTRQSLPAAAWLLLDITRNMGGDGNTPGRAVKRVDMAILDESNPDWQTATATAAASVYMYNERDRENYYVYPPNLGSNDVELIYSIYPTEQVEAAAIVINDVYAPALLDYILWRAYSKESEFGNPTKADQHFSLFTAMLSANGASVSKLAAEQGNLTFKPPQGQGSQVIPPVSN